jgi:hypothetical protein
MGWLALLSIHHEHSLSFHHPIESALYTVSILLGFHVEFESNFNGMRIVLQKSTCGISKNSPIARCKHI